MSLILLVEDHEEIWDFLSRRLKRRGHDVVVATDGQEGVDKARSEHPDIVLLDMNLPVKDGWTAATELKADAATAAIPIIALTAHAMSGDREKALAAGCNDYHPKPIDFSRLLEQIAALTGEKVTSLAETLLARLLNRGRDVPSETPITGRRDRALDAGDRELVDALAAKVLNGWLQNRHQTLFPLTVNLRRIEPAGRAALVGWIAACVRLNRDADRRRAAARDWLQGAGAAEADLAAYDALAANPPALNAALDGMLDQSMAAYAYVAALIALDTRDDANEALLDWICKRLALPLNVIRSANRRYRQ